MSTFLCRPEGDAHRLGLDADAVLVVYELLGLGIEEDHGRGAVVVDTRESSQTRLSIFGEELQTYDQQSARGPAV